MDSGFVSNFFISAVVLFWISVMLFVTCVPKTTKAKTKGTINSRKLLSSENEDEIELKMIRRLSRKSPATDRPDLKAMPEKTATTDKNALSDRVSFTKTHTDALRLHTLVPSVEKVGKAISLDNSLYIPRNLSSIREEPELINDDADLIDGEIFVSLQNSSCSEFHSSDSFPRPSQADLIEFSIERRKLLREFVEARNELREARRQGGQASSSSSSCSSVASSSSNSFSVSSCNSAPVLSASASSSHTSVALSSSTARRISSIYTAIKSTLPFITSSQSAKEMEPSSIRYTVSATSDSNNPAANKNQPEKIIVH